MDKTYTIKELMDILLKGYEANGKSRTMEYTFGFMDAVGILRDVADPFRQHTASVT